MSYTQTHSSDAVTLRGLADNLLTMRWQDMVAFSDGLNGSSHKKITPYVIHKWATDHIELCEVKDAVKEVIDADEAKAANKPKPDDLKASNLLSSVKGEKK